MGSIESIKGNCNINTSVLGCADGVPYLLIIKEDCCDDFFTYRNLDTGEVTNVRPTNFEVGDCE